MLDITHGSLVYARHRPPHVRRGRYRARRVIVACMRLVALWVDRARQRRILATFDDRLLSDIGVTRLEAEREARKPFWR